MPPAKGRGDGDAARAAALGEVVLRSVPVAVAEIDLDGRVVRANESWATLTGRSLGDLLDRPVGACECPLAERLAPHLSQVRGSAQPIRNLELPGVEPSGEPGVCVDLQPVLDAEGTVSSVLVLAREIGEKSRLEAQLREQESRYREALNCLPALYWVIDKEGRLLDWNERWRDRTGYGDEEMGRTNAAELVVPEDRDQLMEAVGRAFRDGTASVEFRMLLKDGRSVPYVGEGERTVVDGEERLIGLSLDITDLHAAREDLRERLRFEGRLADLSSRLIRFTTGSLEAEIDEALAWLLEILRADRAVLCQLEQEGGVLRIRRALAGAGLGALPEVHLSERFPWFAGELLAGRVVRLSSLDALPAAAALDRSYAEQLDLQAILGLPLRVAGQTVGALLFMGVHGPRGWPDQLIPRLELVADMLSSAIARQQKTAEIARLQKQLELENVYLKQEVELKYQHGEIVSVSKPMRSVLSRVEMVAGTDSTALILGETGTGKELLARAIHQLSRRKQRAMVSVNCAALPASLIESELFGREKGAYTGALTRQQGRFEVADGSTIFLDEVSELPLELQAKLLRVLQEGELERLGSPRPIRVDVRVIAASNRDLGAEVRAGRFRRDLFYRLNVFPIEVPPLRERPEDVAPLVWAFVEQIGKTMGKRIDKIPKHRLDLMARHSWPGNVRELRNVVEHAMIISTGRVLELPPLGEAGEADGATALTEMERAHIEKVLGATGWRIKGPHGAAERLGLKPSTLTSRMKKLGIQRPR